MNRRLVLVFAFLLAIGMVAIAGCSSKTTTTTSPKTTPGNTSTSPTGSSKSSVNIVNFSFNPSTLTVKPGTEVTWTNNDSTTHTVVGTGWGSGDIAPGGTYKYTFNTEGTFDYHCRIHPSMIGKVVVSSSASSSGSTGNTATPTTPSTPPPGY